MNANLISLPLIHHLKLTDCLCLLRFALLLPRLLTVRSVEYSFLRPSCITTLVMLFFFSFQSLCMKLEFSALSHSLTNMILHDDAMKWLESQSQLNWGVFLKSAFNRKFHIISFHLAFFLGKFNTCSAFYILHFRTFLRTNFPRMHPVGFSASGRETQFCCDSKVCIPFDHF